MPGTTTEGRRRSWRVVGAATLVALAALAPKGVQAQEDVVKLGELPVLAHAGIYIAMERGYFREQGIRNEIARFASAGKMVPALAADELEVTAGTASAGFYNAIAQGAPYRIVAGNAYGRHVLLVVRKDLADSGRVKTVRDLKGRKVAVLAKGTISDYIFSKMAEEEGLTLKDFDLTFMGGPNQLTALQSGAIEAAMAAEPWGANMEEAGVGVRFRRPDQVKGLGSVQISVIIYSGKFIKERRAVAQRWMDAYLRGGRVYLEKGAQDPEVTAILEKHTKVPGKAIARAISPQQNPGGKLNLESLADQIAWYVANGFMPQAISIERAMDLSFLR